MLRKLQERHLEHITYQQASANPPGQVGDVSPAQGGGGAGGLPEWGSDPRAPRRERPWPGRSTPCPTWSARPGTRRTSGPSSWRPAVPPSVPPAETSAGGDPGGAVCSAEPPHPTPGIAPRDLLLSPLSRVQDSISAPSHRRTSTATAATAATLLSPPQTSPVGCRQESTPPAQRNCPTGEPSVRASSAPSCPGRWGLGAEN